MEEEDLEVFCGRRFSADERFSAEGKEEELQVFCERRRKTPPGLLWKKKIQENMHVFRGTSRFFMEEEDLQEFYGRRIPQGLLWKRKEPPLFCGRRRRPPCLLWKKNTSRFSKKRKAFKSSMEEDLQVFYGRSPLSLLWKKTFSLLWNKTSSSFVEEEEGLGILRKKKKTFKSSMTEDLLVFYVKRSPGLLW